MLSGDFTKDCTHKYSLACRKIRKDMCSNGVFSYMVTQPCVSISYQVPSPFIRYIYLTILPGSACENKKPVPRGALLPISCKAFETGDWHGGQGVFLVSAISGNGSEEGALTPGLVCEDVAYHGTQQPPRHLPLQLVFMSWTDKGQRHSLIACNNAVLSCDKHVAACVICVSLDKSDLLVYVLYVFQMLIGFDTGTVVLWDLKSKIADARFNYPEVSICCSLYKYLMISSLL